MTWPLSVSETGVDWVLIETLLLSYGNHVVLMLTSFYLHLKSTEVCVNRPLSLGSHVESQGNKKLCFCTASLTQTQIQGEASPAKTKLFILLRLNLATE